MYINKIKMVPVEEKSLRAHLRPFLSNTGGIRHKKYIAMFSTLMGSHCEDQVSRQVYCDILESTEKTLLKLFTPESDNVLLKWLTKSLENKELKFQKKFLRLLIKLPIDAHFFENSQTYRKLQELSQNTSFFHQKALSSVLLLKNKTIKNAKMNSFRIPKKAPETSSPPKSEPNNTNTISNNLEANSPEEISVLTDRSYTSSSPMENIYQEFYPNWGEKSRELSAAKKVQNPKKETGQESEGSEEEQAEGKFLQNELSWLEQANKAKSFEKDLKPIIKTPKSEKKPKKSITFAEKERTLTYFEYVEDERVNASRPHFKAKLDKEYEGFNFFDSIIGIQWSTPVLIDLPESNKKLYQPSDLFKAPPAEPIIIPWTTPDEITFDYQTTEDPFEPILTIPSEIKEPVEIPTSGINNKEVSYTSEDLSAQQKECIDTEEIGSPKQNDRIPLLPKPKFKNNNHGKRILKKNIRNSLKNNSKGARAHIKTSFNNQGRNFGRVQYSRKVIQFDSNQFNNSLNFDALKRKQNHCQIRFDSNNQNFHPFENRSQLDSLSPLITMQLGNGSQFSEFYQENKSNRNEDIDYRSGAQNMSYNDYSDDHGPYGNGERWHNNSSFKMLRGGQAYNNKSCKIARGKKPQRILYGH